MLNPQELALIKTIMLVANLSKEQLREHLHQANVKFSDAEFEEAYNLIMSTEMPTV